MASFDFVTSAFDNGNLTTYTFPAVSLGAADAGRYILVTAGARGTTSQTINSVTVGGVAATQLAYVQNNLNALGYWIIAVPSGTTADIVVTLSAIVSRCHIAIWRLVDIDPTPIDTDSAFSTALTTATQSVTLTSVSDGYVVGSAMGQSTGPTWSWTGATKDYDFSHESSGNRVSGAHGGTTTTSHTITATPSANLQSPTLLAMSFQKSGPVPVERSFFRWNGTAMVVQRAYRWTGSAYQEVERAAKDMRPTSTALESIKTLLRASGTSNVKLAALGSSTTQGNNASTAANRWLNILSDNIRTMTSAAGDTSSLNNSAVSTSAGLYVRNGGVGGTTAANYVDATRHGYLTTMQPHICSHMVGSNDFSFDVPKATYKSNVLSTLAAIDAEVVDDPFHLLIHPYQRWDDIGIYAWSEYRDALREIAEANPTRVAFIDLNPDYTKIGIPSSDPLNYIDTDNIHQNDAGHAYMASLLTSVLFG